MPSLLNRCWYRRTSFIPHAILFLFDCLSFISTGWIGAHLMMALPKGDARVLSSLNRWSILRCSLESLLSPSNTLIPRLCNSWRCNCLIKPWLRTNSVAAILSPSLYYPHSARKHSSHPDRCLCFFPDPTSLPLLRRPLWSSSPALAFSSTT